MKDIEAYYYQKGYFEGLKKEREILLRLIDLMREADLLKPANEYARRHSK